MPACFLLLLFSSPLEKGPLATGCGEDVEKNLSHIGFKAGCQFPRQAPTYLDNLARLRLIEFLIPGTNYPDHLYGALKVDPEIEKLRLQYHQPPEKEADYIPSGLELTALGRSFIKACIAQRTPRH